MRSIFLMLACGGAETSDPDIGPPQSEGTVLWVGEDSVLVHHATTRDRTVPGLEHYPMTTTDPGLEVGSHVNLWVDRDASGWGTIRRLEVTGRDPLSEDYDPRGHALQGTVVRVDGARITVDHEAVPGVMMAMVMPFDVLPAEAESLRPSDRIRGTLLDTEHGFRLVAVAKTGTGDAALRDGVEALEHGELLPATQIAVEDGRTLTVGAGQERPTALTFLYTTCPDPNFCPAVATRMGALQEAVGDAARIVAVTIDPRIDTFPILQRYGRGVGADPEIWSFGRLEPVQLQRLAMLSGLSVTERGGKIEHLVRLLILDGEGRLIERYDDNTWPLDRVVEQLKTGAPKGPKETGTLTPAP